MIVMSKPDPYQNGGGTGPAEGPGRRSMSVKGAVEKGNRAGGNGLPRQRDFFVRDLLRI